MKLKDLKRKLDLITNDCDDFDITIDAGDSNLLYLEKVAIGGNWNIILSADEDEEDIEDDTTISVHRKKD